MAHTTIRETYKASTANVRSELGNGEAKSVGSIVKLVAGVTLVTLGSLGLLGVIW